MIKILLVGSFRFPMYAAAFEKGFKSIGSTVLSIDTYDFRYSDTFVGRFLNRIMDKFNIGYPLISLNKKIVDTCKQEHVSFVFFYYCCGIYPMTIKRIHETGSKVFTYCNDDPFSRVLRKPWNWKFFNSLRLADWNFVYRSKNILDYASLGVSNVSVLMPYYLSNLNFPLNVEKDIPIAFMGHWEPDGRDQYIKAILDSNLPLFIYGDKALWKYSTVYNQLVLTQRLRKGQTGEEYNKIINRFQIALIFISKLNYDTYTRRCFEIPATKTLMLCEYTDDMNHLFPENECAVYFRNEEELVNKIKYLLSNPECIEEIANNGYKRLKEIGGSEVDRCQEIINVYLKNK